MSIWIDVPNVVRVIKTLKGGSQPFLAQASDGERYVVKFFNNIQGPSLLFNEAMGAELYHAFGLPVPYWKPVMVTDSLIDQNPHIWIQTPEGCMRPDSGLCFGSRFIGSKRVRLLDILPEGSFRKVLNLRDFWLAWLIDVCSGHADQRQAIFPDDGRDIFMAWFVDHGHMLGGPNSDEFPRFQASRYSDWRVYRPLPTHSVTDLPVLELERLASSFRAELLWHEMRKLPEDWVNFKAVAQFTKCLDNLTRSEFLRDLCEMLIDSIRREQALAAGKICVEPRRTTSNPIPRLQIGELVPAAA